MISEMLKKAKDTSVAFSQKPYFEKVIVGILVIVGLIVLYQTVSYSLNKERVARANDLKKYNEQVTKMLSDQKQKMEEKYAGDMAQANSQIAGLNERLQKLSSDRMLLARKVVELEASLADIRKQRREIETREYTKTDLDSKFSAILLRGKR